VIITKKGEIVEEKKLCWNCKEILTLRQIEIECQEMAKFKLSDTEIEEQKEYLMCSECSSDKQRIQTWNEEFDEENEKYWTR